MKLSMGFYAIGSHHELALFRFWYCHPVVFINQYLYVSSVRTQLLGLYTFDCPVLLHVSAIFGHHQVGFAITCMEKNTVGETSPLQLTPCRQAT
jgi:hypothetical protein